MAQWKPSNASSLAPVPRAAAAVPSENWIHAASVISPPWSPMVLPKGAASMPSWPRLPLPQQRMRPLMKDAQTDMAEAERSVARTVSEKAM